MTARDFAFWLQGFLEIHIETPVLSQKQVEIIKRHLNMVFEHEIDPSFGDEAHQNVLNAIHTGNNEEPVYRC